MFVSVDNIYEWSDLELRLSGQIALGRELVCGVFLDRTLLECLPLSLVDRLHPKWDSNEVSVVVTNQGALLLEPLHLSDTSDLVDSIIDIVPIVHLEGVFESFHLHLVHIEVLFTPVHFNDHVKVRTVLVVLSHARDLVLLEVLFGELPQFA